jgi:cytosine deaminase
MTGAAGRLCLGDVRIPAAFLGGSGADGAMGAERLMTRTLVIEQGRVAAAIGPGQAIGAPCIAGGGRIVMPALCEAHVHLDKCFTIDRLDLAGGGLLDRIAAQARDKRRWTEADLRARAGRALGELYAAGVATARTHVDWGWGEDPSAEPPSWGVLRELRAEWSGRVALQIAALVDIDVFADAAAGARVAATVAQGGGVLGGFVYLQPRRREGIARMVAAASRLGLMLDFHVDEGLDPALDGLDVIAAEVIGQRHDGPVLCGHASSLANLEGDALAARIARVAEAGLGIVTLPTTNLFLQDRMDGPAARTPVRRGITRLHELAAAGVTVAVGTDNVADAFMPVGCNDPMAALATAVMSLHLDAPLDRWLPCVTSGAARAIGATPTPSVVGAALDDLVIADASTLPGLIGPGRRRRLAEFLSTQA